MNGEYDEIQIDYLRRRCACRRFGPCQHPDQNRRRRACKGGRCSWRIQDGLAVEQFEQQLVQQFKQFEQQQFEEQQQQQLKQLVLELLFEFVVEQREQQQREFVLEFEQQQQQPTAPSATLKRSLGPAVINPFLPGQFLRLERTKAMLKIAEESAASLVEASAKPMISFTCAPEDIGVIAQPIPAKQAIPDWFKVIPAIDRSELSANNNGLTVKRCMPFLDALTTGWIIPIAATVRIEISEGGSRIDCGWEFDKEMISPHNSGQVRGHPKLPMPPMKFHNHWTIVTPEGWSCLFIPPLNRPNPLFEIASGIVDTDRYRSPIHFPFFATAGDGVHVIEKGTPIAQVIPFRREMSALAMDAEIRAETSEEFEDRERIRRLTMASEGWYRKEAREQR